MFDFTFLGFYGLFWQTIVVVVIGTGLLAALVRKASLGQTLGLTIAWAVLVAPLLVLNWTFTSGDPAVFNNPAMSMSVEQVHYPSLLLLVAVMTAILVGGRFLVRRSHAVPSAQSATA